MPWPMKLPTSSEPGMLQILPVRSVLLFHVSLSTKKVAVITRTQCCPSVVLLVDQLQLNTYSGIPKYPHGGMHSDERIRGPLPGLLSSVLLLLSVDYLSPSAFPYPTQHHPAPAPK